MSMGAAVRLPIETLSRNHLRLLNGWEVSDQPEYAPPCGDSPGLYVWHGIFVKGETIAMMTPEDVCQDYKKDPFFAGLAFEQQPLFSEEPLDVYIATATTLLHGVTNAIEFLNQLRGLPSGERVRFPDPVLTSVARVPQ